MIPFDGNAAQRTLRGGKSDINRALFWFVFAMCTVRAGVGGQSYRSTVATC